MGQIAAKYRLCRCRCKINGVMKEDTSLPTPLPPPQSSLSSRGSLNFSTFLTPIRHKHPLGSFLLPCSAQIPASEIALVLS